MGYEERGQLTERVRRRLYSVILLDEIEKAHPDVHNILQVFDDGRLTDGKGRTVDFSNTIIIATSNLGSELIQQNLSALPGQKLSYEALKEKLMEILRRHFRPEFGARELRRKIQTEVENPLAEALLSREFSRGDHVRIRYDAKTTRVTHSAEGEKAPQVPQYPPEK